MPTELTDLIREIVSDPPVNRCADDGTTCTFCCADYDYHAAMVGKPVVTHAPDCWLNRAAAILARPIVVFECSEWDGDSWDHFATCATIEGARAAWIKRMKGVTFAGDPIEVFRHGMKVGGITASKLLE